MTDKTFWILKRIRINIDKWLHKVVDQIGGQDPSSFRNYNLLTLLFFDITLKLLGWEENLKSKSIIISWIHIYAFVNYAFSKCWFHMKIVVHLFICVRSHMWVKVHLFIYVSWKVASPTCGRGVIVYWWRLLVPHVNSSPTPTFLIGKNCHVPTKKLHHRLPD